MGCFMFTSMSSCSSLPPTRATPSRHMGLMFRMNKGDLCKYVYVKKYGKCCLWVYFISSISEFCKSSTVICLSIFKLQLKLLRFCKKNLYFKVQPVKRFSLNKLEQRLMSLSFEFNSPVKREFKAEQTTCSLAEINSLGEVRFENVLVGHSVRGFAKTLVHLTIFSFR